MNEKVTLQAISDIFASQYGVSKKVTDAFGKSFFDTIVDGLNKDGQVKIKGLGTFKIVEVSSRESVNVTNGERFVIDGYKKVSFTPDELAEQKKAEVIKQVETAVAEAASQSVEETKADIESALQNADESAKAEVGAIVFGDETEPADVETPKDELSGIDMLISTPESVEEVAKDVQNAKERAEKTLEEAKAAQAEYRRLELLLDRLENNQAPEALVKEMAKAIVAASSSSVGTVAASAAPAEDAIAQPLPEPEEGSESPIETEGQDSAEVEAEEPVTATPTNLASSLSSQPSPSPSHEEALNRYLSGNSDDDNDNEYYDDEEEGGHKKLWIILALILLILGGVAFYLYNSSRYEIVYDMSYVENKDSDSLKVVEDTIAKADSTLATKTAESASNSEKVMKKEDAEAKAAEKIEADKKAAEKIAAEKKAAEAKAAAEKKAAEAKAAADKKAAEAKTAADKKAAEAKTAADKKAAEAKTAADKKAAEAKAAADKKAAEAKAAADKKAAEAKAKTPKTHILAKGQSLTKISQIYYGTKDSVRAIIRVNNFKDPDNVPVGAVVKLP